MTQKPRNASLLNWIYPVPYPYPIPFLLALLKCGWGSDTKHVFLRFLKFDIPFIFNFLLKYDVCTEVGTDHEYTAQWIFTNWISTGHGLDHQIKNRALVHHVRAHLCSLGPFCTILPAPHPIHSPDFQQIFARFYIPFYFNLKVLEIDFLKNQIVRKWKKRPLFPASYVFFQR